MYVAIGYNPPTINTEGRTSLPFQTFVRVSKFSAWKKLNASLRYDCDGPSATVAKISIYFQMTFIVSRNFLQRYIFFCKKY